LVQVHTCLNVSDFFKFYLKNILTTNLILVVKYCINKTLTEANNRYKLKPITHTYSLLSNKN